MVLPRTPFVLSFLLIAACGDNPKTRDADAATEPTTSDVPSDTSAPEDVEVVDETSDVVVDETSDVSVDETQDAGDTSDGDASDSETSESASFEVVTLGLPVDLTPDGAFAIFWDNVQPTGDVYLYDVERGTSGLETSVGTPLRDFPTAISSDLQITALYGEPVHAGVWTTEKAWRTLGSVYADGCGEDAGDPKLGEIAGAWDISADGTIVVGLVWNDCRAAAFRWSDDGETRDFRALDVLGSRPTGLDGPANNRATVVSDDGLVAAGWAEKDPVDRWPAIWSTTTGAGFLLETTDSDFPADAPGEILAISADGAHAVGVWNLRAFAWTEAGGVVDLGTLPDAANAYANAVAASGTLVFGTSAALFDTPNAFVWTEAAGMRKLSEVAAAHGVVIDSDLQLTNVLASSSDGSVLIGTVMNLTTFMEHAFVLRLPAAAYLD